LKALVGFERCSTAGNPVFEAAVFAQGEGGDEVELFEYAFLSKTSPMWFAIELRLHFVVVAGERHSYIMSVKESILPPLPSLSRILASLSFAFSMATMNIEPTSTAHLTIAME